MSRPRTVMPRSSRGVGAGGGDLDLLRHALADQQVVALPDVVDDVLVHLVAGDADGADGTMPPREMTATSVVPPPMSTIMLPEGSVMGSPAPMAAAIGSSIRSASRAPALQAASWTARLSTSVTPLGMPTTTLGRGMRVNRRGLADEVVEHLLGDVEVRDDAVFQGADGDDIGRGAADHPLGLGADGQHLLGLLVDGDDGRLVDDDALAAHQDEGIGGAEVDADVPGHEAEDSVDGTEHRSLPGTGAEVRG